MTSLTDIYNDIVSGVGKVQSPYLYLQGAGSDTSDGSADGIHLRWDLLRALGDSHIPKGNLAIGSGAPYPAPHGYNKADDFVELLKVPYTFIYPCVVNFTTDFPVALVETGPTREWKFDTVVMSTPGGEHCEVVVRFADTAQYDTIRATYDPMVSPSAFLAQYTGIVEALVTNKLCFAFSGSATPTGSSPQIRVEAISTPDTFATTDLFISCRKTLSNQEPQGDGHRPIVDHTIELRSNRKPDNKVMAENVVYFRFDYSGCTPAQIRLETYEQFILGAIFNTTAFWQPLGSGFALTDQDTDAYERLENSSDLNIDQRWPKYYGANQTSGLFTTSVDNYKAKWDPTLPPTNEPNDANGLRQAVISYLTLSQQSTNPLALDALSSLQNGDQAAFDVSYLQLLKIVGLDYHVARMLGLGHIDTAVSGSQQFIYLSIYHTLAPLETGSLPGPATHLYMTLPTSRADYRLPPPPVQLDPTYGITIDNGTGTPLQLTDPDGYTPFDDARIVNLQLQPFDTYQAFGPFYVPPVDFCSDDMTKPVFYGFKYKLVSESNYRVPEISNDEEYTDASGAFEVAPILPQGPAITGGPVPPVYVHEEKEEGDHQYAFYGINWFSRVSNLSNIKQVDTNFPVRHTLLPPANFSVQLIQPESPEILTTIVEQAMLASLTSTDKTLVRLTFDWNQNHYRPQKFSATNEYADKAQFFFRQDPPRAVQGEIKSVTPIPSTQLVEVRTQSYLITSTSPPQTITPNVLSGDESRFVGSLFSANQISYVVDSVFQSTVLGEGAVFHVKKQLQTTGSELSNTNVFSASVEETIPAAGERFLVVENMNNTTNWNPAGDPLVKEVSLVTFLESGQLHQENVTQPDGTISTYNVGGVFEQATITEKEDIDENGNIISGSRTGLYEIVFSTFQLANHPDTDVEWYKGSVRIIEDTSFLPAPGDTGGRTTPELKVLDVWKIDVTGSTLKLTVYDSTFDVDSSYQPQNLYVPIETSGTPSVNFHPGYRVYLMVETGVLDETTTLPATAATSPKQSFMATRSLNTNIPVDSFLSTPVVLQGRYIITPIPPALPLGPLYATRPNFYGKSSWTMDVGVTVDATHEPYAVLFYRANEQGVLDVLYRHQTVAQIVLDLFNMPSDDLEFESNRWNDLVNCTNLHADGGFSDYLPGGYRFPIPDNTDYVIPGTMIAPFDGITAPGASVSFTVGSQTVSMLDVVRMAVNSAFLPLTETPPIYQFVKTGTQTSSRKPVTRNSNGDLIPFSDPQYDATPMIVKYTDGGNTFLRFTDYTIDGASRNIYFYYAIEMNDEMKFSGRSPIAGPIKLVNAYPAETPTIRKIETIMEDASLNIPTSVKITVDSYLPTERILYIALYRANNSVDATSIRTMTLVRKVNVVAGGITEVIDNFGELEFPLYGDPLFYRVVALRSITNEFNQPELIPSQQSSLALASIVDVNNPPAPQIAYTSDAPTVVAPIVLNNVKLQWSITAYNATYYLYKMDTIGNWVKIYQVKTNSDVEINLADTDFATNSLVKQDDDGDTLYYRFKVGVENSSGLLNKEDKIITV